MTEVRLPLCSAPQPPLSSLETRPPLKKAESPWERWLPWAIWLLLSLLSFGLVTTCGLRLPFADEWRWLPVVAGDQPVTAQWLWQFDNEHRLVLPKLVYLGLLRLTATDFRSGGLFSVAVLSLVAALLLVVLRKHRGFTRPADACVPLALLHWAQIDNLLWGFQLHFVLAVGLILVVLALVFRCRESLGMGTALAVTGCLLTAALCGPYGVAFLPPFAGWLLYAATARCGSWRGDLGPRLLLMALAIVLLVVVPLLHLGHPTAADQIFPPAIRPETLTLIDRLRASLQFLANAFGPAAKLLWPVSGLLILVACLACTAQLGMIIRRHAELRLRAAGMLALLAGIAAVALVIGWTRAFMGSWAGFESRYTTLTIPLTCLFYLQCQAFAFRRAAQIQQALFIALCVLIGFGAQKGLSNAAEARIRCAALHRDAQLGITPRELAQRYTEENFILARPDEFAGWLETLRSRGWYPYSTQASRANSTLICPMIDVSQAFETQSRVRLTAGQQQRQRFRLAVAGQLWRIDLQVGKWRWPRGVDEFAWQLRDATATSQTSPLAEGRGDYRQCAHYRWITLPVPSVRVAGRQELELILSVPESRRPGQYLEVPLYQASPHIAVSREDNTRNTGNSESLGNGHPATPASAVKTGNLRAMLFLRPWGQ